MGCPPLELLFYLNFPFDFPLLNLSKCSQLFPASGPLIYLGVLILCASAPFPFSQSF